MENLSSIKNDKLLLPYLLCGSKFVILICCVEIKNQMSWTGYYFQGHHEQVKTRGKLIREL